jgi:L-threonylcarbamoyladenylate synthase
MPTDPAAYAVDLYTALHRLDAFNYGELVVQTPPNDAAWEAVHDRLRRARTL